MNRLKLKLWKTISHLDFIFGVRETHDILLTHFIQGLRNESANPLVKQGYTVFSQFDEDGIIAELCRRINFERGYFLELGVGDGTENNTLNLLAKGWKGCWLGGQSLIDPNFVQSKKLRFQKQWIDENNVLQIIQDLTPDKFDLISVDLDGNDLNIWEKLLSNYHPKIAIAEYNGRFDPLTIWNMPYNESHKWGGDLNFGASLLSLTTLFKRFGYTAVATSLNGTNVFFVAEEFSQNFLDVPTDESNIWNPARAFLFKSRYRVGIEVFRSIVGDLTR